MFALQTSMCVSKGCSAPRCAFAGGVACSKLAPIEAKLPCRANAAPSRALCWAGSCTLGVRGGVAEWETDSRQHILTLSFNAVILLSSRSKEKHCTIPVFPAEKVISLTNNNTAGCLQFFNCVSPMQKQAHKHWDKEGVRLCVLRVAVCRLSQIFHYRYLRKPHACSSLPAGFDQGKYCTEMSNMHVLHCLLLYNHVCVAKQESFIWKNSTCEHAHSLPASINTH